MRIGMFIVSLLLVNFTTGPLLAADESPVFTQLVVQMTGGIGGMRTTYDIKADGSYKIINHQGEKSAGKLPGDQLKAFTAAVAGVDWANLPRRQVEPAPDHTVYTVAILTDGKYYNRTFNDVAHSENKPMQTFIGALVKVGRAPAKK